MNSQLTKEQIDQISVLPENQDSVAAFITNNLVYVDQDRATELDAKDVYSKYLSDCQEQHILPLPAKVFHLIMLDYVAAFYDDDRRSFELSLKYLDVEWRNK